MKKVLVLGTFRRHLVPPEEIVSPVLERIGWDGTAVEFEEHFIDGRSGLDFADPNYLEDAVERARTGIGEIDFTEYHLVVVNVTGFNPSAQILVAAIGAYQEERYHLGLFSPDFWGVQFDRERGYLPYQLGPRNGQCR